MEHQYHSLCFFPVVVTQAMPIPIIQHDTQSLDDKILSVLTEAVSPMTPQEIAHLVGFPKPNNQASRVNPILYKLWEIGAIQRTTNNGLKPRYSIIKSLQ